MANGWLYNVRLDTTDREAYQRAMGHGLTGRDLALQVRQHIRKIITDALQNKLKVKYSYTKPVTMPSETVRQPLPEMAQSPNNIQLNKDNQDITQELPPPPPIPSASIPDDTPPESLSLADLKKRAAQAKKNEL